MLVSLLVAGAGLGLAWAFYRSRPRWLQAWLARAQPLVRLAGARYYVDEIYERIILRPYDAACRAAREFDARAVDGAVNAAWRTLDVLSHFGRYVQTGFVRNYALLLLLGAVLILYWVLP